MQYFIFECRNGQEQKAKKELESLGMKTLLPMGKIYGRRRRRGKERPEVTFPLWQGYVVGGGRHIPWTELRKRFVNPHFALYGPLCLGNDGMASPIGPKLLEEIRGRSWIAEAPFSVDDEVRVTAGPFVGNVGRMVDIDDSKAEIVLNLLGKSVRAEFDPAHLEKVA